MVFIMRRWRQTITIVPILMILICVMVGCGKVNTSSPDIDTVSFMKDGKIVQTIVEDFAQDYYDVDELAAMTQDKIDLYSDSDGDIKCESVNESDGIVTVKIAYQADEDYMDFNSRELFFGTVKAAHEAGYVVKDMVLSDGESLSDKQLEKIENNRAVIIETGAGEELGINVYGKILYVSGDVTQSGKKDAIIGATDEGKLSCIVFK